MYSLHANTEYNKAFIIEVFDNIINVGAHDVQDSVMALADAGWVIDKDRFSHLPEDKVEAAAFKMLLQSFLLLLIDEISSYAEYNESTYTAFFDSTVDEFRRNCGWLPLNELYGEDNV